MIKLKESDLLPCCGSKSWATQMAAHSFPNLKEALATCDSIWWSLTPGDWKQAFAAHPKIGERANHHWSQEEQAAARHASDATMRELHDLNLAYEERFGYIFIVCANGRSAHSILEDLRARLPNDLETEIKIAAEEQLRITHLRLKRILGAFQ